MAMDPDVVQDEAMAWRGANEDTDMDVGVEQGDAKHEHEHEGERERDQVSGVDAGVLIVVMGVSGTGKTTLGKALSTSLSIPYIEGDDLHPASNVQKMANGIPLNDEDRLPWLGELRRVAEERMIKERIVEGGRGGVVLTCSALKKSYRDVLRGASNPPSPPSPESSSSSIKHEPKLKTYFIHITGPSSILESRMQTRQGHFMKVNMLQSQLATLEDPEKGGEVGVVSVSLLDGTEEQVEKAKEGLRRWVGWV